MAKTNKAQLAAIARYNKENTKTYLLRLNKETEKDIIDWLEDTDNKSGYIKDLIRKDISQETQID